MLGTALMVRANVERDLIRTRTAEGRPATGEECDACRTSPQ